MPGSCILMHEANQFEDVLKINYCLEYGVFYQRGDVHACVHIISYRAHVCSYTCQANQLNVH